MTQRLFGRSATSRNAPNKNSEEHIGTTSPSSAKASGSRSAGIGLVTGQQNFNMEEYMTIEFSPKVPGPDETLRPVPDHGQLHSGVDLRIGVRPSGIADVLVATSETDWLPIALTGSTTPRLDSRKIDLRLAPVTARLLADLLETAADLSDGTPR